ncbi:MAG: carbohydrate ABC transporter permease [Oscillospiraceae bacterium]|nr:carbohydrate ABC transporter permease [Oscillospiraceae bacterium]
MSQLGAMTARRRGHTRRTMEDRVVDAVVYIFIAVVFIVTAYPFWLSIVLAFNEGKDAQYGGIFFWPRKFSLDNFKELIRDSQWGQALGVSVARTVLGTVVTVIGTSVVAYGLSYKQLVGRKVYMALFIFAMYFSGGIIPYYMVLRQIKLLNTFFVYIIPGMINMFYVLVSISFFQEIPGELGESARLDGAGEMSIFLRVMLPISKPLLATLAIFMAVGQWNNWFDTAFFTQNKALRTMAYQLMSVIKKSSLGQANMDAYTSSLAQSSFTTTSIMLAAMLVAVGPILIVYPFFQRYFVTGLTIGSVKG